MERPEANCSRASVSIYRVASLSKKRRREMFQTVHKSIEISAPVEKVFSYLEEPSNELEWIESMTGIRNINGSGAGTHYECSWKMAGVQLHGETTRTEDIPNERIVDETNGLGMSSWTYTLEPHGNTTILDLELTYSLPEPVLRKLCKIANQLISEQGEGVVYRNHVPLMAKLVDAFVVRHTEQEI